jgi:hypothetical protein
MNDEDAEDDEDTNEKNEKNEKKKKDESEFLRGEFLSFIHTAWNGVINFLKYPKEMHAKHLKLSDCSNKDLLQDFAIFIRSFCFFEQDVILVSCEACNLTDAKVTLPTISDILNDVSSFLRRQASYYKRVLQGDIGSSKDTNSETVVSPSYSCERFLSSSSSSKCDNQQIKKSNFVLLILFSFLIILL